MSYPVGVSISPLLPPTGEMIMQRVEVIIRYVDDEDQVLSENNLEFQMLDVDSVPRDEHLDQLESDVLDKGHEIMRHMFLSQCQLVDRQLADKREHSDVDCNVQFDGSDSLKIASRLGILELPRRVCYCETCDQHFMPLNAWLPEHKGMITTRGLQEWACLLPQELPFSTAQRLLGWVAKEPAVLSQTQLRTLVREHGGEIRQAEAAEVSELSASKDLSEKTPNLLPLDTPRHHPAWPGELHDAVEQALAEESSTPPEGVSQNDWDRVITYQKQAKDEVEVSDLARLGPKVDDNQVVASVDGIQVRRPQKRRFHELRTAKVIISKGYRYVSGADASFPGYLLLLIRLCLPEGGFLTLLADGAHWIREFYVECLHYIEHAELILDWYHLAKKKCKELCCMIARGREAKDALLNSLKLKLWHGKVADAISLLEAYRPQARNEKKLNELIGYLRKHQEEIPDYNERRIHCQFNGSAHVEKANDLLVARRQKHQGMHWSLDTSASLCALKTLMLNHGWELYWQEREVLPLAA
jgi:hypothetical protein